MCIMMKKPLNLRCLTRFLEKSKMIFFFFHLSFNNGINKPDFPVKVYLATKTLKCNYTIQLEN